jgi:hypothetical protein
MITAASRVQTVVTVWLIFAPAARGEPAKAEPAARVEPAAKPEPSREVDAAVNLITNRPRLEGLRPTNARQELSSLIPGGGNKWKSVKTPLSWDEEAALDTGPFEKVTASFEHGEGSPADWQFRELSIELRGSDTAAQVKELARKVQERLGKPKRGRPRGGKVTDITWSLKDDWSAHVAVQPLPLKKGLTLILFATSVAPEEGD